MKNYKILIQTSCLFIVYFIEMSLKIEYSKADDQFCEKAVKFSNFHLFSYFLGINFIKNNKNLGI